MVPNVTVFVCIMCVGVILTGSRPSVAAPNIVPKLNVRPSCESPARRIVANGHANGSETCLKKEREAHGALIKNWSGYVTADKTNCVGKVSHGGPPSYIELLSCLEIRENAREIRQARHKDKTGSP
jgi:hypothetical protein